MPSGKIRNVTDLLVLLAKPSSLEILRSAENEIMTNTDAHLQFGLDKRQYHRRLLQLANAGLIEYTDSICRQTRFGRQVCSKYIPNLEDAFSSERQHGN